MKPRTLDLNEVLQHPGKKIAVPIITHLENDAEVTLMQPLQGELRAMSTGNILLLEGEFKGSAIAPCARCSSSIEVAVDFEVDEQFQVEGVPAVYGLGDHARIVQDEPYPLFQGNALLVDELLRQDLVLEIPMQPLCQYGWDGPCPYAARSEKGEEDHGREEFQKLARLRAADEEKSD